MSTDGTDGPVTRLPRSVVIVGAGHAGFTVASELRVEGFAGEIALLDEQSQLPYQRPPLSKAYLNGDLTADKLPFRGESYYAQERIDFHGDERVAEIDRAARRVTTAGGRVFDYDALVLATGADTIRPPFFVPDLIGLLELRTRSDADRLIRGMGRVKRIVVVGGGFIGLEVACAARKHGLAVVLVEMQDRLMARAVGETVSRYALEVHRAIGIGVRLGARVTRVEHRDGRAFGVTLDSGEFLPSDMIVLGLGVRPRTELAAAAGLEVDNGVVVDEFLETSDPAISAVGDCCSFPYPLGDRRVRLESVQNATDHARHVAKRLTGKRVPFREVPWFWSDQGGMKLQMAGAASDDDREVVLGDRATGKFSVLRFSGRRLVSGESVNSTGDHVSLRTIVAHGAEDGVVTTLDDPETTDLRQLARSLRRQPG
jgi:3-phenylpropionate/trans-cinnamate dioxygenase ferredoxin reductase subunit